MGVPKFYRWLSERYPKINQVITDSALLPEFDHLYLDMNGIIHGCTHPSHLDQSDTLSEKDMMLGIMHYLDRIITQIVKPKVSVFMAIDGVAPRAKLNQQRSRRFRSARDMKESQTASRSASQSAAAAANNSSSNQRKDIFDSNCITPGTEFMEKVSNCIKYFIRKKIKEDPLWKHLKVIYSGHEIPGEGEHKIMQHLRDMKNQPGYKPNTRHCMYGQDADLIMLGLVSHEPHFTLLREIVEFGNFTRNNDNALKAVTKFTKQSDFQLLHLSILREYLAIEFAYDQKTHYNNSNTTGTNDCDGATTATTRNINLERIIDDWVFMTFLVGNDFLPHMPTLDISYGAFDLLFNAYKEQRVHWGDNQYLTDAGNITDAARLEAFLEIIGNAETEIFETQEENEAQFVQKQRKWNKRDGKEQGPSDAELAKVEKSKQNSYQSMIHDMIEKHGEDGKFVKGWTLPTGTDTKKKDHKGRYYFEKLHLTPVDIDEHLKLRQSYIEGLMWCLAYYYRGCISWGWFYPYHYGPLISDLTDLPKVFKNIKFDIGAPLKPFEQLMGCLPPASANIVPKPYRKLMLNSDSPIIQFYPEEFEVDMNGKRNPWEGVNILPFIDIQLLKETLAKFCPDNLLTADERRRNSRGKVYCYMYDSAVNDTVPSFNRDIGIHDITKCKSKVHILDEPSIEPTTSFKPTLLKGTQIPYPGFPSLNVLPIKSTELKPISLNCFGSGSKYATMVLSLHTLPELPGAAQLADNILGKHLFINWPMMHEAKVVAVSDEECTVRMVKNQKKVVKHTAKDAQKWVEESEVMNHQYLYGYSQPGSGGVEIGDVQIRLKLVSLQGMKVSPVNGSSKKVFGTEEADVPLQMVLWQSPAPDPRFEERGPLTLKDRFPSQSQVVLTKGKFRGYLGTVLSVVDDKVGVRVEVPPVEPPFGLAIARSVQESYISTNDAASVLKMNPVIFSKVTGSLFFQPGNYDLGLNLKYQKDYCVLGYTRRRNKDGKKVEEKSKKAWGSNDTVLVVGNQRRDNEENGKKMIWEYTPKAVKLVAAFRQKFPTLFNIISKDPTANKYDATSLGPKGVQELPKIREWLNNVETAKMPRTPCTTEELPQAAILAIQRAADVRVAAIEQENQVKHENHKIPASALYLQGSTLPTDVLFQADGEPPELGDRIVNLCANGLPFGARGTVVGIHHESTGCVEVVMDKEFIGGSTLQGSCSNFRGKLCVWNHLLKVNASNSKDFVNQMIPTGSGKAVIDSMLKVNGSDETKGVQEEKKTPVKARDPNNPWKQPSPMKLRTGGKQGAWREAAGPSEKGNGFKGVMRSGGKSGLQAWKKMMSSNRPTKKSSSNEAENYSATSSEGLKTILGVKKEDKSPAESNASVENLKNILGVKNNISNQNNADASVGLKSLLGIGMSQPDLNGHRVQSAKSAVSDAGPSSAADALMKLMVQTPIKTEQPAFQPQQSTFNFTYVNQGDKSPAPVPMQPIANTMVYPNGPMYHSQVPQMGIYPNMMPNLTMITQQPNFHSGNRNESLPIPINRANKEKLGGVEDAALVPSVAMKSKK